MCTAELSILHFSSMHPLSVVGSKGQVFSKLLEATVSPAGPGRAPGEAEKGLPCTTLHTCPALDS